MSLMVACFRAYPWQTSVMIVALILAGISEGMGLSALLPLLSVASGVNTGGHSAGHNEFEQRVISVLHTVGLQPTIGVLLVIIVVGVSLKNGLLLVAQRQVGYTAAQVATDLRLELLKTILRSHWAYFIHQPVGRLTNTLASEAARSSDAFVNGVTVITFAIQATVYGVIAFAISWKASLVTLVGGALIVAAMHFLVRMTRRAGRKQTKLLRSLMARLNDTLQAVKPLKAMAREHLVDNVMVMETSRLNKALRRQVFSSAVLNSSQDQMFAIFIALGIYTAIVHFGMPFTTVTVLVVALGQMLAQMGKVQKQYQKMTMGESAFWAMRGTIDEAAAAEEALGSGREPVLKRAICFDKVEFSYGAAPVFHELNLEFPVGSLTLLIGPSGAGKTTIIDLTIGLLQPQAGSVLVDDFPLTELDIKAWRSKIGYVPQETFLLHDTIAHNITLGDPDLNGDDVEFALRGADAWDFVSALSDGIHSVVGERGGKLSGGQRQRIMIARALVRRPVLLILDEATSALDPASEQAVRETLEKLRGRLTILAISHQAGLVESADRVYRLEAGRASLVEPAVAFRAVDH